MSAKTSPPEHEHILILEDDKGRREIVLKEPSYSVGREKRCDIRLQSQFVSRRHATLLRKIKEDSGSYYEIVDGDPQGKPSANGLLINGRKLSSHPLKHGDEVVFGPKVYAIYQIKRIDPNPTEPDPFDITLIDPGMMEDNGLFPSEG